MKEFDEENIIRIPEDVTVVTKNIINGLLTKNKMPIRNNIKITKEIIFHEKVTRIGGDSCSHLVELERVIIPDSVEVIEHHAFRFCGKINYLSIGNGVKRIGMYAFQALGSYATKKMDLPQIIIGESVENISTGVFNKVSSIKLLAVSTTHFDRLDFDNLKSIEMLVAPPGFRVTSNFRYVSPSKSLQLNENYTEEYKMQQINRNINLSNYNFTNFKFPLIPILGPSVKMNNKTIFKDADMTNIRIQNNAYNIFEAVDFETYPPKAYPNGMLEYLEDMKTTKLKQTFTNIPNNVILNHISPFLNHSNTVRLSKAYNISNTSKQTKKKGKKGKSKSKSKKNTTTSNSIIKNTSNNSNMIGKKVRVNGGRFDGEHGIIEKVTSKKAYVKFNDDTYSCIYKYQLDILNSHSN